MTRNSSAGAGDEAPVSSGNTLTSASQEQETLKSADFVSAFGKGMGTELDSDAESGNAGSESVNDVAAELAETLDRLDTTCEESVEIPGPEHVPDVELTAMELQCNVHMHTPQAPVSPIKALVLPGTQQGSQLDALESQAPARLVGLESEIKAVEPELLALEQRTTGVEPQIQAQMLALEVNSSGDDAADGDEEEEQQQQYDVGKDEDSSEWDTDSECTVETSSTTVTPVKVQKHETWESQSSVMIHELKVSPQTQSCHQQGSPPSEVWAHPEACPRPERVQSPLVCDTKSGPVNELEQVSQQCQEGEQCTEDLTVLAVFCNLSL